ncbi:MAG: hypothetical protein ACI8T1_002433 [Verrucomicrobiales bacterium]|jgi:hypothetical protein
MAELPRIGQNVAYNEGGTISQILSETLAANTKYSLQVEVGRAFSPVDYSIQLYAGGSLLAGDENSLTLVPGFSVGSF